MRNKVLRFCEGCLYGMGYGFMIAMGLITVYCISFAFWHLITDLFS